MTRILAVGDIHGCYRSLDLLLAIVQPTRDDVLVTLGDYVDRGPNSCQVIDRLLELEHSTRLIPLRGNHETMMIEARNGMPDSRTWMLAGGSETLDSYNGTNGRIAQLTDVPKRHWEFLSNKLLPYWESEYFIFVHGCVEPDLPMSQQSETTLYWMMYSTLKSQHYSGKTVVCGHEIQDNGLPARSPFAICIDTGAWNDGWLTCFSPEEGKMWQANELGQTRQMSLGSIK